MMNAYRGFSNFIDESQVSTTTIPIHFERFHISMALDGSLTDRVHLADFVDPASLRHDAGSRAIQFLSSGAGDQTTFLL